MNIVFVTVGTSAVDNEELWEKHNGLKCLIPGDIREFLRGLEEGEGVPPQLERALLEAHEWFWAQNENYRLDLRNRRLTSAEAISTYTARISGLFTLNPGQDKIVLLLSDTPAGQLCGRINKALIAKHAFFHSAAEPTIDSVTLKALSPAQQGLRWQARPIYSEVNNCIGSQMAQNAGAQAIFNITGSYKGLIPPITHIATTQYPASKIIYMHETMPATVIFKWDRHNDDRFERTEFYVDVG